MFDRPELVLAEVRSLLQAELFDSAEALVSFYLSATQSGEPVAENSSAAISAKMLLADFHEASGDALFGKKEFKRACSAFQSAELAGKGQPSSKAKLPFSAVSSSGEAKLRFKQALCLHELKEPGSALKCLETIPAKYRTLGIHKMMGDLYCESNLKRNAIGCYKEALLLQPLAVEIAERLVDLGVESSEVLQTLQSAAECRPAQDQAAATPSWLSSLILAFAHRKSSDHRRALSVLKDLNGSFPRNLYLLSQTARTSAGLLGQTDNTLMIFRHIHKLDRHYVQDMDLFAGLLHSRGEEAELNKLASSLIEGAPSLPQTWLAAGWYCASKGDLDNALSFVDKAIILAPHHGESFLAKGQMQTKQGSPELALISFSQAHSLEKSLSSMLGLIESNLLLGKLKEAANWSRECLRQFPKAPEAYWAMGNVLAKSPGAPHESIKAYSKALKLQPKYEAAASALATMLLSLNRTDEAIDCLQQTVQKISSGSLRLLLAKALSAAARNHEALDQLQVAASLSRGDLEVMKEIERVEGMLKEDNNGFAAGNYEEEVEDEDVDMEDDYMDDGRLANRSLNFDD